MRNNGKQKAHYNKTRNSCENNRHKNSFFYKLLYTKAITHFRTFAALKLYA